MTPEEFRRRVGAMGATLADKLKVYRDPFEPATECVIGLDGAEGDDTFCIVLVAGGEPVQISGEQARRPVTRANMAGRLGRRSSP